MLSRLTATTASRNQAVLFRQAARAIHQKAPFWEEEETTKQGANIPDHIGWVTLNDGVWKMELAHQAPGVPVVMGSWWQIEEEEEEEEVAVVADDNEIQVMNRNARIGRKANHGKRPCSRQRRRHKRRMFGNHKR